MNRLENISHVSRARQWRPVSDPQDFGKVAVLYGGNSAERDVSLMSGQEVFNALLEKNVNVSLIDLQGFNLQNLKNENYSRVWIALHGRGGEDGSLQGALELLEIPYTGSGVLGSALCMDKLRSKQILVAVGLPTPVWMVVDDKTSEKELLDLVGLPLVIKPSNEGSSIGMSIVTDQESLARAITDALELDSTVIAEQFIEGQEITASVLQNRVLPLIHIETPRTFYDYEAKYFSDNTRYHCPATLPESSIDIINQQALDAFRVLDAYGWGRVDFMLDADHQPWILEVNTVPGMTTHSLVPMAAAALGISFPELVWKVLETSFQGGVTNG